MLVKNTGPLPVPNVELAVRYRTNPVLYRKKKCTEGQFQLYKRGGGGGGGGGGGLALLAPLLCTQFSFSPYIIACIHAIQTNK